MSKSLGEPRGAKSGGLFCFDRSCIEITYCERRMYRRGFIVLIAHIIDQLIGCGVTRPFAGAAAAAGR